MKRDFSSNWSTELYAVVLAGFAVIVTRYVAASLMYFFVSQLNLGFSPNLVLDHHGTLCEMVHMEVWRIFQLDKAYSKTQAQF